VARGGTLPLATAFIEGVDASGRRAIRHSAEWGMASAAPASRSPGSADSALSNVRATHAANEAPLATANTRKDTRGSRIMGLP
jgi:hypothetical protein